MSIEAFDFCLTTKDVDGNVNQAPMFRNNLKDQNSPINWLKQSLHCLRGLELMSPDGSMHQSIKGRRDSNNTGSETILIYVPWSIIAAHTLELAGKAVIRATDPKKPVAELNHKLVTIFNESNANIALSEREASLIKYLDNFINTEPIGKYPVPPKKREAYTKEEFKRISGPGWAIDSKDTQRVRELVTKCANKIGWEC